MKELKRKRFVNMPRKEGAKSFVWEGGYNLIEIP